VISTDRIEQNEAISGKNRKHKAEVKRLTAERAAYEERANGMVKQMTEQMTMLQETAMERIQVVRYPVYRTLITPTSNW
jgi:hypothetical protein